MSGPAKRRRMYADRNARALIGSKSTGSLTRARSPLAYLSHSCSRGLIRLAKSRTDQPTVTWTGPSYWKTPCHPDTHDLWPSDLDQRGNPFPHRRVRLVTAALSFVRAASWPTWSTSLARTVPVATR